MLVFVDYRKVTYLTFNLHSGSTNTDIHPPLALSQTCHLLHDIALYMAPSLTSSEQRSQRPSEHAATGEQTHLCPPLSVRNTASTFSPPYDRHLHCQQVTPVNHICSPELVEFSADPPRRRLDRLVRPAPTLEYNERASMRQGVRPLRRRIRSSVLTCTRAL